MTADFLHQLIALSFIALWIVIGHLAIAQRRSTPRSWGSSETSR